MIVLQRGTQTDEQLVAETFMGRVDHELKPAARAALERMISDKAKVAGRKEAGRVEVINSIFGPGNGRLYQIKVFLH